MVKGGADNGAGGGVWENWMMVMWVLGLLPVLRLFSGPGGEPNLEYELMNSGVVNYGRWPQVQVMLKTSIQ